MLSLPLLAGVQTLPGREQVHDAIARVLAAPPFATPELDRLEQLLASIRQAIDELKYWAIRQLGDWLGSSGATGPVVLVILVSVAVVLLASIVVAVVRPRAGARPRAAKGSSRDDVLVMPAYGARLEEAHALAASGRFADAMSSLYQAACLWLDDRGHARYEDEKTGGDYAREITSSELRGTFRRLLAGFYPVAYGGRPASPASWKQLRSVATELGVPE
jgi:hypothetical protein